MQAGASAYLRGRPERGVLTREDELNLARRMEEGEFMALRALCGSPAGRRELAAIGEALAAGDLRLRDVLRASTAEEAVDKQAAVRLAAVFRHAARAKNGFSALEELGRAHLRREVLKRLGRALRVSRLPDDARALERFEEGMQAAERARKVLIESHIGLVFSLAQRHTKRGLVLHDLVQEGTLGLMRAADKFDYRRARRFMTCAAWWVDQQMTRAIADQARTIRLPVHIVESRRKVRKTRDAFTQERGREPTEEELLERTGLTSRTVRAVDALVPEPASLYAPVAPGAETEAGELVADVAMPAPDEQIAHRRMLAEASRLLEELSFRERYVLKKRFGWGGTPERTLAEIGAKLSLSRERVRQIERIALEKLRTRSEERELETYLE
jgi:RNA polymerase primary sigma factor